MNELVQRLSTGSHAVSVGGPQPTLKDFQKRVTDLAYVFIKFTSTRGGTDLGIRVDKKTTNVSNANFTQGKGIVHLEGHLILNYVNVKCVADIDLATLAGSGHLIVLETVKH